MFSYTLSQGNPEGTDYSLQLEHETPYGEVEFHEICESAIVETLNKMVSDGEKFVALSCIDPHTLFSVMEKKGFRRRISCDYYLEPYWNQGDIKNPELLEWAKGKKHDIGPVK